MDGDDELRHQAEDRDTELDRLAARAVHDTASMGRLLTLIRPPVLWYCRARMGSGVGLQTPDDVAQDVLLAVCTALGSGRYQPGGARLMSFVYGIASNKVVDAYRAEGRDHSEPGDDEMIHTPDPRPGPEGVAVRGSEVAGLRELLDRLPELHREILVLRIALGFTAIETAGAVGSTPGAVRVTQHRALQRLRGLMTERLALEDRD